MKKFCPNKIIIVLFLLSFFFLSPQKSHSEEKIFDADKAFQDYLYNTNLYRESHSEYIVARESYLKYQTLTSKNAALEKTRTMLKNQDEVVKTYLTTLRLKLAEVSGITNYGQNVLYLRVDDEIPWFKKHQESLNSAGTLEDLISLGEDGKEQYQETEILAYQTLGAILTSKQSVLYEEIAQRIKELKEKIGEIRAKGDKNTSLAERWLLEAENRLTRSQEKQFNSQQLLAQMKTNDFNKNESYNKAQFAIEESHQYLKEANSYLKEVIRELKNAD